MGGNIKAMIIWFDFTMMMRKVILHCPQKYAVLRDYQASLSIQYGRVVSTESHTNTDVSDG